MKTMWVKSAKAVHLVDAHTPHHDDPKEFFFLNISEKEAMAGISKEVPANPFFHGAIAMGILQAGDAPKRGPKPKEVKDE